MASSIWVFLLLAIFADRLTRTHSHDKPEKDHVDFHISNLPQSEIDALHSLYNSTDGDNWQWLNSTDTGGGVPWVFTADCNPCTDRWQGVTCTVALATGVYHVSQLSLDNRGLAGSLPDNLDDMPFMQALKFQGNELTGTIPASLGNFTYLLLLDLSYNNIIGSIPEQLVNATSLRIVNLNYNHLTGTLPEYFVNFPGLINLVLNNNKLTGTIPESYGTITTLQVLNLGSNILWSTIPNSLSALTALTSLVLEVNYLSGTLPDLSGCSQLQYIYLDYNGFYGPVPEYFGSLASLQYMTMNENYFSGTITAALGDSTSLQNIYLHTNNLSGRIPSQLGQLAQLLLLDLHNNDLTGTISEELGNLSQLTVLILYGNRALHGTIPAQLGQLSELQTIDFSKTALTGTLPSELCRLQQLVFLKIHITYVSGPIPENIGNMTALSYLSLHDNLHTSTVPASLKQLQYLGSLFIFNNKFTGNIPQFISSVDQPFLQIVQISGNRFTGQIPDDLFALPQLQTVILGDNCFHGTLPTAMCNATTAITLSLDGLQSGTSCREIIFPGSSDAYVLTNHIRNGIPFCLFEMKRLNTLHLSGNGLTGPLPNDVDISVNLVDLSLSHNKLTGHVPRVFQERIWYNFDLSYNKFKGTLSDSFGTVLGNLTVMRRLGLQVTEDDQGVVQYSNPNGAVTLRNNRLSNTVPSVVSGMYNVSVLKGNLFGCELDQNDLPKHDEGRYTYTCGSNGFNVSFYIYLIALCAVISIVAAVYLWRAEIVRYIDAVTTLQTLKKWFAIVDWYDHDSKRGKSRLHRYKYVMILFDEVCRIASLCTLYIMCVQMPLYAILSHYKGTHNFEYAWSVSAAFLSGSVAVACQLVFFCIMLVVLLYLYQFLLQNMKRFLHNLPKDYHFSVLDSFQDEKDGQEIHYSSLSRRIMVYVTFFLINVIIVGAANVGFVYTIIYSNRHYQTLAQLSLSVFKLIWNNFGSIYLIRWTHHYLASSATKAWRSKAAGFFAIQLFVQLFNYIVVPCVVVAAINPDCFNNAVVSAPAVTSYFYYDQCSVYSALFGCVATSLDIASTSYNPPFTYSYECSSNLITFYAPTFVYLGFYVTFISPLWNMLRRWLLVRAQRGTTWFAIVSRIVPLILHPVSADTVQYDKPYSPFKPYFDANQVLVTISAYLGVLLTFGFVFPPLALVMLVSICSTVYVSRIELGRFLTDAISDGVHKYTDIIETECTGVGTIPKLVTCVRIIVCFIALFYTPFLFDTLGDEVGLSGGFWVLIVVPSIPVLIWCCHQVYGAYCVRYRDVDTLKPKTADVEMRVSNFLKSKQDQDLIAEALRAEEAPAHSLHLPAGMRDFELQSSAAAAMRASAQLSNRQGSAESELSDGQASGQESEESSVYTFSAIHKT